MIIYLAAAALVLSAAALGLALGSTRLDFGELIRAIAAGNSQSTSLRIFRYSRLPRTLSCLFCGAALSVSGAVIQAVLANRLASPSVIGVNSGAGLAVTLCSAFGVLGGWRMSLAAFAGAFVAVMLVSLGARRYSTSGGTLILMGVAMNSLFGAISDTVITFAPDVSIMSNDFRIGDFSAVTYTRLLPAVAVISVSLIILLTLPNQLDVLSLGEERAHGLGLNTSLIKVIFLTLAALLAGAAVSVCGLLSFVGLLVPHAVRRIAGDSRARHILPLCALFGGGFVTLCDTLSRIIFAPFELPVGIIMAFLGAPFFIFILISRKKGGRPYA